MNNGIHRGYYKYSKLPHFDVAHKRQFVTFRLADSLPYHVLESWKHELRQMSVEAQKIELRRKSEKYLDEGHGECVLSNPHVAQIVKDTLMRNDGYGYRLFAFTVMPNHVHVLIEQKEGHPLAEVVRMWKSRSAVLANRLLKRTGSLWQLDYFDRYIRDSTHFGNAVQYIGENPVKANLVKSFDEWPHMWLCEDLRR